MSSRGQISREMPEVKPEPVPVGLPEPPHGQPQAITGDRSILAIFNRTANQWLDSDSDDWVAHWTVFGKALRAYEKALERWHTWYNWARVRIQDLEVYGSSEHTRAQNLLVKADEAGARHEAETQDLNVRIEGMEDELMSRELLDDELKLESQELRSKNASLEEDVAALREETSHIQAKVAEAHTLVDPDFLDLAVKLQVHMDRLQNEWKAGYAEQVTRELRACDQGDIDGFVDRVWELEHLCAEHWLELSRVQLEQNQKASEFRSREIDFESHNAMIWLTRHVRRQQKEGRRKSFSL